MILSSTLYLVFQDYILLLLLLLLLSLLLSKNHIFTINIKKL